MLFSSLHRYKDSFFHLFSNYRSDYPLCPSSFFLFPILFHFYFFLFFAFFFSLMINNFSFFFDNFPYLGCFILRSTVTTMLLFILLLTTVPIRSLRNPLFSIS